MAATYTWPIYVGARITNTSHTYNGSPYKATDFGVPVGTDVYAVANGTVITVVSKTDSYGKYIVIDHGNNVYSLYAHLSEFKVSKNDYVVQGQVIALSGNTGNSTGPHLHFEIRVGGNSISYAKNIRDYCTEINVDPNPVCNCSESYAGTYICTSRTTLNIRGGHSASGSVLGSIPSGAEVYVSKADGSWAHVSYNGIDGFASMQYLERKVNNYPLDLNGLLDDRFSGSLEEYGTADVYINGALVADDVSDYYEVLPEGTYFEFTDFKARDGYMYTGFDGTIKGQISSGTNELKVMFCTAGNEMSSGYDRTIPDGDYLICAARNPDKTVSYFLDIEGTAQPAENGTNVSLCGPLDYDPPSYEAWNLTYQDGFYTIKQVDTNMCLDVASGTAIQGENIHVWNSNGTAAQKWAISYNGTDGYRIQAKCSGFSLDIAGGVIENGKNVSQWKNNDSAAQAWLFIPYRPSQPIENGRYILMSALSDHLELDVDGDTGDVPENVNVQVWEDSAPSKYNSFDIQKLSNGFYKFTHAASGKCLEVSNGTSGYSDNIALHTDNGSLAQQWAIIPNGNGYCVVAKCSGYAMDVCDFHTENGTNVLEYPIQGSNNQTWVFVPAEYTVKYDANGGEGAPENQTKYYKENLKLSASEPIRSGYKFLGWGKTKTETTAQLLPGDDYYTDESVTLYAVWEKLEPDLVLPRALTVIEEEAFEGGVFTYVKLPENTTTIRSKAFANCRNLKHIYIPETTTIIASDAFSGVDNLLTIHGVKGSYAEFYAGKYGFQFVEE